MAGTGHHAEEKENNYGIVDALGRRINHIRISLTNRCNLSCFYCHHEGNEDTGKEMTTEEVVSVLAEAKAAGMASVKFTGGEPLLRKDILEIVRASSMLGFNDISLTTNGTFLPSLASDLKASGLMRVNIGCDSMDERMPKNVKSLKDAISSAKSAGLLVKLNMVVLRGTNDDEIDAMLGFCMDQKINLQLIELIESRYLDPEAYDKYFYSLSAWEKKLKKAADYVAVREMQGRKRYYSKGIFVEFVRPDHNFCKKCNKIRVTSDGKIRQCLVKKADRPTDDAPFSGRESIEDACRTRGSYGYG